MVIPVGHEFSLRDALQNLIHLNYDVIEACQSTIDRLDASRARSILDGFIEDQQQLIDDLARHLSGMGHAVPDYPGPLWTQGKARIAASADDNAVLAAMATSAAETASACAIMAERQDVTGELARRLSAARDKAARYEYGMQERGRSSAACSASMA